jgi:diguanylate cyclase (GGDEF)-like protein/PAS domain S-box-containing protein
VQPGEQQLRSLAVDGAGAGVWEWNERRDEVKVSSIMEAILGLKTGELSTKIDDFAKHMHPTDRERFKLLLASIKERPEGELRTEFRMRHADNSYRWFELEAAAVPAADRRNVRCVGLIREVTDAKRAQERLMHDAVHDSLSGLPNRELFLDRLGIIAKRATLEPLVRPALLFIDIDKFKSVNASFGLIVGDSLLLTIARRLGRNLGPQDTLGRVGGDQFALLLLSQSSPSELAMLAEQVRRSLRAPINIAGQEIVLTASIGIALYDGPDEDPAELLREAEIAMYRAKRAGPDRIEIFNAAMRTEKDSRPALEGDLRRAIEKKQLRLLYQPIYYLPTETLAGFEALLRWEHPTLGPLNPAEFIPVAEETDLIVKLGSYVLSRAVREVTRWQRELPRPDAPVFVGVNVSSRQLFRPELVKEVRLNLGRAVIPKGSLRLEVTESLVMENPEKATAVLRELAEAGVGLALDDFGTGYSSLSYLNQFTFDTIKIDRSFLQASEENGTGSVILRSIIALAHELGKNVVVEGVEREEDVGLLRTIGCGYGQGSFYGEPMSEREALQLLKVARRTERRMKRRSLLRKREKIVEEAPLEAAPADAPTPQPASVANGAEAPEPQAVPPAQAPASQTRAGAPSERARPPGGPPPLPTGAAKPTAVPLRTMPPTPLRPGTSPQPASAAPLRANGTQEPAVTAAADHDPPPPKTGPPPLPPKAVPLQRPGPPPLPGSAARSDHRQAPPTQVNSRPPPDFSKLPPAIAESLAKLAGRTSAPPSGQGSSTPPTPAEAATDDKPPAG